MKTIRKALTRETIARLTFELLVIFVGVSAAFIVDNYRERAERDQQSKQIYTVLAASLKDFHVYGSIVRDSMVREINEWDARDTTQFVMPPFYREPGGEGPPVGAWEALLAGGGINVIDTQLFWDLTNFFNRVGSMRARYQRYTNITEQILLPSVYYGPAGAYQPGTHRLKPEIGAHIDLYRNYLKEHLLLMPQAQGLERRIKEQL